MYSFEQLYQIFSEELGKQNFTKSPKELYEPIAYTLSQSGKRLRPIFTLMASDLFGGDIYKSIPQALAIELLHNFTLVHDDIMDEAPLRHGQETVHTRWNQKLAILAGDTLYALAYRYVMQSDKEMLPAILETFNSTALEACEGQQMDINFESLDMVSKEEYLLMSNYKTAALFGASMRIGSIIAGAPEKDVDLLALYGRNLGMAFQLRDDLLDLYGEQKDFGKKTGLDIIENKKTYLFVAAMELADDDTKELLWSYYHNNKINQEEKIAKVKGIFDSLNIEKVTNQAIEDYVNQSLTSLEKVDQPKENKVVLEKLAKQMISRKK
ncbi:MAG: polyprenyl synthetase family protein [Bacteroidales bacterium]|nr:polyprenyl synthetase family protein [Bacteroidales bacterium]